MSDMDALEAFCLVGGILVIIVSRPRARNLLVSLTDTSAIYYQQAFSRDETGSGLFCPAINPVRHHPSDVHFVRSFLLQRDRSMANETDAGD